MRTDTWDGKAAGGRRCLTYDGGDRSNSCTVQRTIIYEMYIHSTMIMMTVVEPRPCTSLLLSNIFKRCTVCPGFWRRNFHKLQPPLPLCRCLLFLFVVVFLPRCAAVATSILLPTFIYTRRLERGSLYLLRLLIQLSLLILSESVSALSSTK